MYDTIILKFPVEEIDITYAQFDLNPAFLPYGRKAIWQKATYCVTPNEYLPKVCAYKQPSLDSSISLLLSVEFSIGKLLYGNNIETPRKEDFDELIDTLYNKLRLMDICVSRDTLKHAQISRLDVSKVINTSNCLSSYTIISSLEKVPVPQNLQHGRSSFLNNGKQFTINTDQWRLSVYDKIAEIAHETATVPVRMATGMLIKEMPLLEALRYKGIKHLLRIEYQIVTPKQLRKCLKETNHDSQDISFQNIYDENIATDILSHCWNKYIVPHISTCTIARTQKRSLVDKAQAKNISINRLCQLLGYKELLKLENAYSALSNIYANATPRVFLKEVEKTANKLELDKTSINKTLKYISEQINSVAGFRLRP